MLRSSHTRERAYNTFTFNSVIGSLVGAMCVPFSKALGIHNNLIRSSREANAKMRRWPEEKQAGYPLSGKCLREIRLFINFPTLHPSIGTFSLRGSRQTICRSDYREKYGQFAMFFTKKARTYAHCEKRLSSWFLSMFRTMYVEESVSGLDWSVAKCGLLNNRFYLSHSLTNLQKYLSV